MSRAHNPRVIEELRDRIAHLEGSAAKKAIVLPFGVREMDEHLPGGGLAYGALHEIAGGGAGTVEPQRHCSVWQCAPDRYPGGLPPDVLKTVRHEFDLIKTMKYATVFSIVRYGRSQGILCQGKGSAANSAGGALGLAIVAAV
jgi:hypothetical protein